MPLCKQCKKKFHACSSCCLTHDWEYEYCGEKCWLESDEYKEIMNSIEKSKIIIDQLSYEELELLAICLSNEENVNILLDAIEAKMIKLKSISSQSCSGQYVLS